MSTPQIVLVAVDESSLSVAASGRKRGQNDWNHVR